MFIVKLLLLVGLIRLLFETNKPLLCASIYVAVGVIIGFLAGHQISSILIAALIAFILTAAYFWLLDKFQDSGFIYYAIMIVGFLVIFI